MIPTVVTKEIPEGFILSALQINSGVSPTNDVGEPFVTASFAEVKRVVGPDPSNPEATIGLNNSLGMPAYRVVKDGRSWSWVLSGSAMVSALIEAATVAKAAVDAGDSIQALVYQGFPENALRQVAEAIEARRQAGQETGVSAVSPDAP